MNDKKDLSTSKEDRLTGILSALMSSEDLHDVKLKGSDGVEVGANRCVLAAQSSVFKAMLFGQFSEALGDTVSIAEYKGSILRAVVEYIYTDEPQVLNTKKRKITLADDSTSLVDTKQIETIVSLATAANFFDLPGLTEKVKDFLFNTLEISTPISFALLEACNQQEPAVPDEITEFAWSQVRSSAKYVEDTNAVACLSKDTLEEILKDEQMKMTEYDLFRLLISWVESSPKDRKVLAMNLVHLIRLEGISPIHLSSVVEPSGLATPETLFKAYKSHSMAATGLSVEKLRLPAWCGTSSSDSRYVKGNRSVLLDCLPMKNCVHQWTLERVGSNIRDDMLFGVALGGGHIEPGKWLTDQKGTWGFQMDGSTKHEGELDFSQPHNWSLAVGEQVTLTLDLRKNQQGNGTLTGCIKKKDGNTVAIGPITDLLDELADDNSGFVPAIESGIYSTRGEEVESPAGFLVVGFTKK